MSSSSRFSMSIRTCKSTVFLWFCLACDIADFSFFTVKSKIYSFYFYEKENVFPIFSISFTFGVNSSVWMFYFPDFSGDITSSSFTSLITVGTSSFFLEFFIIYKGRFCGWQIDLYCIFCGITTFTCCEWSWIVLFRKFISFLIVLTIIVFWAFLYLRLSHYVFLIW